MFLNNFVSKPPPLQKTLGCEDTILIGENILVAIWGVPMKTLRCIHDVGGPIVPCVVPVKE